jgi:hypothetical protein
MWPFRDDKSVSKDVYKAATDYYADVRKGMREKADHNKRESQLLFYAAISFTLAAPLFVTLGEGALWGKIVPAILSVLAAGSTSWLQFRKPQRLWAIYRRAQRELEREKAAFDFGLAEYGDAGSRDKTLARKVSEIAFRVHEQWEGLVPEPETLGASTPSVPITKD